MRLIDADALKHHYSWWGTEVGDGTSKYEREVFDSIVDAQPTIEAVFVIMCKDCKESQTYPDKPFVVCHKHQSFNRPDWFCADGEKVSE